MRGGALFFYIAQKYKINKVVICNVNQKLIITFNAYTGQDRQVFCGGI
ncbi:MAG: hypothetical protein H7263_06445 [Candidatus Sericytochromatia bacterium]|nr:hypothetical protein [Candidatus Sericytochromatia bacterium]